LAQVHGEADQTQRFRAFCGSVPPRFANPAELECARIFDWYGIPWEYEPRSFVLECDPEGRVTRAFTPDFFLPEQNLFIEVTVMKQSLVTRKNRKLRELRALYPDVRVKLFYRRDIERLAQRYHARGGNHAAHLQLALGETMFPARTPLLRECVDSTMTSPPGRMNRPSGTTSDGNDGGLLT